MRRSASPWELRRLCRSHNKSAGTVSAKVGVFRSAIIRAGVHLGAGLASHVPHAVLSVGPFPIQSNHGFCDESCLSSRGPLDAALDAHTTVGPGLPPKLCLNSKLLRWVELNSRLKAELSRRSVSLVYVEADPNVAYQDVLEAIDASRILNAKVVLLRTEFK